MIRAGIYGASGYTGFELVRILAGHPAAQIAFVTGESSAGASLADLCPTAPALDLIPAGQAPLDRVEVVFLCLPQGAAAPTAVRALEAGVRVIDLSADFRLRNPAAYHGWYGQEHPAPHLLEKSVYGLTELARDQLFSARLVANPGCYPTSILLPLHPLVKAGACAAPGPVIADSKSGVSGAGRAPRQNTHFVEVSGNLSPYAIGRTHRHLAEMEQALTGWSPMPPELVFSPHLLPVPRGILSTLYVPLAAGWNGESARDLLETNYAGEPFVRVLPVGKLATLAHANHTNRCVISLTAVQPTLIIVSVIDNLIKGAAGQAVQNMNRVFGLDESAGLI